MAGSVNRVILVGRVGKDPSKYTFPDGNFTVSFSLATSETWKDRASGERRENTTWHNIVVRNPRLADVADKYVQKGATVYVEGSIGQRKYQKDGVDHYVTEIIIGPFNSKLEILSNGKSDEAVQQRQPDRTDKRGNPQYDDMNDEVPF